MTALLEQTARGLFCAAGGFYIDPGQPVDSAVITHAHSDHARPGSRVYLTSRPGAGVLAARVGTSARIETVPFGETVNHNGVGVTLFPAGHILGSSQVRVEYRGEIWVVSGDYKTEPDITCEAFEPVRCHTFITESTFGLPIYRWNPQEEVFGQINDWWRTNQEQGRTSVLFGYSLGKAQRLLAGVDPGLGPIFVHGSVERFLPFYQEAGVPLPPVIHATADTVRSSAGRGLVIAPASTDNSPWLRQFGEVATAFASGWMRVRGTRRWRSLDRGFVLSDHADWPGLLQTIRDTGASRVLATHGYTEPLVRWLRENGWAADALATQFGTGEGEEP